MTGSRFPVEVRPLLPETLKRLSDLANDLYYSWDHPVRQLFFRLDHELWECCGHNPKVFLRRVAQDRLDQAAQDRTYLEDYRRVVSSYDAYREERIHPELAALLNPETELVAYFCAEFGFHESFPIYSGGLGILAGDYCKAASDLGIPFVGVGLLYQHGYFSQTIDGAGNQSAHYLHSASENLPIRAAEVDGQPLVLELPFPGRHVRTKVWEAKAGHIRLYFLDTDVPENSVEDRGITYQLYGGDIDMRIRQEFVLGIGGTLAINRLGLQPTVWHINEGHAAFQVLERCRQEMQQGLDFDSALELVASSTLFTTHTPVPAGHDIFHRDLAAHYLTPLAQLWGLAVDHVLALGQSPGTDTFNMTTLALRGSRYHNGVSQIHGDVAARMESTIWPEVPGEENPISYVTNGVHVPTFLAREWASLFDMRFSNWQSALRDTAYWEQIEDIPDYHYWSTHKALKHELLEVVREKVIEQHTRNGTSPSLTQRMLAHITDSERDVLVMGFARRFATYKRATLLFHDTARLARLLNHPEHPGVIIFAGKAHPKDHPGQQLIKVIHELSLRPEFIGRILLLEGYDLALARRLVSGVDVWINTPEHPLEASGTSGQKAAINGAVNLSVLDGWWAEGFNGQNGWGIKSRDTGGDPGYRNSEEATELLDIIEHQLIPLFYEQDGRGYSQGWVKLSKASMKSIIPRYNAQRMVMDYIQQFYAPAARHGGQLRAKHAARAKALAHWKGRVRACWPGVSLDLADMVPTHVAHGDAVSLRIRVRLNGLTPDDVRVECLVGAEHPSTPPVAFGLTVLEQHPEHTLYGLDLVPPLSGLQNIRLRAYPTHPDLSHPFETGCMRWI